MNTIGKMDFSDVSRIAPQRRDVAHICFIGAQDTFSDVLMRALESEMPEQCVDHVPHLEDIAHRLDEDGRLENGDRVCALIVDESYTAEMRAFIEAHGQRCSRMRFAIAYSGDRPDTAAMDFLSSGAVHAQVSFLPMDINITTWVLMLRIVLSGGHYIPPALASGLAVSKAVSRKLADPGLDQWPQPEAVASLTPREWDVLKLVATGQQNKIIADHLKVSEHTAKLHTHRIINKLGVSNRTAAAIWYHCHKAEIPLQ